MQRLRSLTRLQDSALLISNSSYACKGVHPELIEHRCSLSREVILILSPLLLI